MCSYGTIGEVVEVRRTGACELSVEWHIQEVLLFHGDGFCESPSFGMCDMIWCLELWPNYRDPSRESKWLKLAIYRQDKGPFQTYSVSVGIRGSQRMERRKEVEMGSYPFLYWCDFCSRSRLSEHKSRLMPEDVLTITCVIKRTGTPTEVDMLQRSELKSVEDIEATLREQGMDELKESLQRLLANGEGSNCLIKVQGKEFRAHSLILQARSPVFHAMFSHDMLEKQSGVVNMEDCDQEMFPDFLEHVYTGSVEMISTGNAFGLYSAAEKYDLKTLKNACAHFVKKNLTAASFCHTITQAMKHDDKELIEHATEFFCCNTLDIIKTAEWQIFIAENPTVGNELHIKKLMK